MSDLELKQTPTSAPKSHAEGKFHHLSDVYVAGPALFPTVGSADPSLTGLALARKATAAVIAAMTPKPSTAFKPPS
jgi:choline dehydrogenase-like flavoprotein